jgi:hypothetical protein
MGRAFQKFAQWLTGSGLTTNTLPKVTGAGILGNSRITDSGDASGSGVSIDLSNAQGDQGFNVSTPDGSLAVEVAGGVLINGSTIQLIKSNQLSVKMPGPNYDIEVSAASKTVGIGDTNGDSGNTTIVNDDTAQTISLNAANGISLSPLPVYANNAAAIGGGLVAGMLYRTGGDPDPVCVVH